MYYEHFGNSIIKKKFYHFKKKKKTASIESGGTILFAELEKGKRKKTNYV
jgi:hypothetical protein